MAHLDNTLHYLPKQYFDLWFRWCCYFPFSVVLLYADEANSQSSSLSPGIACRTLVPDAAQYMKLAESVVHDHFNPTRITTSLSAAFYHHQPPSNRACPILPRSSREKRAPHEGHVHAVAKRRANQLSGSTCCWSTRPAASRRTSKSGLLLSQHHVPPCFGGSFVRP